jgi:hypothetical protein
VKRLAVIGLCFVAAAELLALTFADRAWLLAATGVVMAAVLLSARRLLSSNDSPATEQPINDAEESLRDWISRTQTLIQWSETTRMNWDHYLRPRLAREFAVATGNLASKNRAALQAAGRMVFGDELWQWVDPENVARTGGDQPGPGRAALNEILQRLERV